MKLHTVQLGRWRLAKNLNIPLLDVTLKSGDRTFSPTPELLSAYKAGEITDKEYTVRFKKLMELSYKENKQRWLEVCKMEEVAIACYCGSGNFCHRKLLVSMFRKVCKANAIMGFTYVGELEPGKKILDPHTDGTTHLNVYSRAKTWLGRALSNFAEYQFVHPRDGKFFSVEAYWYWRKMKGLLDEEEERKIRSMYGFQVKAYGKELFEKYASDSKFSNAFKKDVKDAIRAKIEQNDRLLFEFVESDLPFEHYYVYWGEDGGYKVISVDNSSWIMDYLGSLRKELRKGLK